MTADNAAVTTTEPKRDASRVPQLRTLLLTDLCDSTALVDRLGDGPAAGLFRQHDQLVLKLQQRWRGRLIDRSDGLLLLFERPIDGLGFALDYGRGLSEIGAAHKVELKARAGLHVGEVLSWRNSDAAVELGAKPLEVEGLAKPMAARLMSLARPGQILLSAVAEPLAHRAARELGERGQQLLWKSHGRWRLKGTPDPQEIFEVGEPGIAPLRVPKATPKARRDVPFWRRPAALAAELALLAGLAVGAWFITRPQPAIAFNQRDWVVVADLRNLTGQAVLDDSLEQAFRISLEQSRYVNVLSDLKARQTLERMRLPPDTVLDRAIASEIALRDGARAVILPTVAEVGGHVRVSAEVIDPHSQTTVYSEYADGPGVGSALDSIDKVTAGLREQLGEALESIENDSEPLPKVTTGNLNALRAYALGHKAFADSQWEEAIGLYQRAVSIDPKFALAHLALARVYVALSDYPAAMPYLEKAIALRDRLPERDQLYLDAWQAELRLPGQALSRWKLLASMYPDYFAGQANAAWALYLLNDFDAAMQYAAAADSPRVALRGWVVDRIGRIQLAQGRTGEAMASFERANDLQPNVSKRRQASGFAVLEKHRRAVATIESIADSGFSSDDPIRYIDLISLAADQAKWALAGSRLEQALGQVEGNTSFLERQFSLIEASVGLVHQPGKISMSEFMALADANLAALEQPRNATLADDAFMALVAGYLAQRAGHSSVATKVLKAIEPWEKRLSGTVVNKMAVVVRAENQRLAGNPEAAIQTLKVELDGTELVQARVAMFAALRAAGRETEALEQADWLLDHRGRAYMEANASQVLQTLNVLDTRLAHLRAAQMLKAMGEQEAASRRIKSLLEVWPRERMPDYLLRKVDEVLPASKQKMTV